MSHNTNSSNNEFLRFASPNERRAISREYLGFYNALILGAVYEFREQDVDLNSTIIFAFALQKCIEKHPPLSMIVKNAETEKPYYERVPGLNLENHEAVLDDSAVDSDNMTNIKRIEKVIPPLLDLKWTPGIPPWKIVVLRLQSSGPETSTYFVGFTFSHGLGDGISGLAFHRTFLNALRSEGIANNLTLVAPSTKEPLQPAFDTAERLPISWSFLLAPLLAVYLPKLVASLLGLRAAASTIDAGSWTGEPMFYDSATYQTRLKVVEIEASLVERALRVCRSHNVKLTAIMHQFITRALSTVIPASQVTNFVSQTAVNMRGSVGVSDDVMGFFVSGHYDVHPRVVPSDSTSKESWTRASVMTQKLAECVATLQDQPIGLLRYAPSITKWTAGKLGQLRDSSYEVSNLGSYSACDSLAAHSTANQNDRCKITKMLFSQPASVTGAPLSFNIVSVKGGSLVCAVSWQVGAMGIRETEETTFVDQICTSVRQDFEAL